MPWQAARLALVECQRAALRLLAHLRQDGEKVPVLDQLRHAFRDILHAALDGPELHPVRRDQRLEIPMGHQPHDVAGRLQALAQRDVGFNVPATA